MSIGLHWLVLQVIGDGAFFSQLMQLQDGYTDGHRLAAAANQAPT